MRECTERFVFFEKSNIFAIEQRFENDDDFWIMSIVRHKIKIEIKILVD